MRTSLHVQRRPAARKPLAQPRDARRSRRLHRHAILTRCGYLISVAFI